MSKSKSKGSKDATKTPANLLNKVKDAVVTKPAQSLKVKSKEMAKQAVVKEDKKSKKKTKEPTPEPSDLDTEDSVSDSDSEVEEKAPAVNGKTSAVTHAESSDESDADSDSSESSADEAPTNGLLSKPAAVNGAKVDSSEEEDSDDSEDEAVSGPVAAESSDESDSEESDEETVVEKPAPNKGPVKAVDLNKKLTSVTSKKAEDISDADSDDSAKSEDSEEGSDSDGESDSEEEVKSKPAHTIKRKAEDDAVPAAKKTKTVEASDESQGNNLFVGNLSWNVDEAWLTQEFETFGELSGVRLITDRDTGRSKGFGYVEFVNAVDAAKAHASMKGTELDGRAINVDFANNRASGPKPDRAQARAKIFGDVASPPSDTLFIGNLAFDVGQDTVSQAFGDYGTILGVRLPTDRETGQPKGYGYITFTSIEEAKGALEAMQGADISGRSVRLDYSQPRPQNGDSPARGRGGFGGGFGGRGRGRGGFGDRGGRGGRGRGGFGDRGGRGGRGGSTNRGGFGDFAGKKTTF